MPKIRVFCHFWPHLAPLMAKWADPEPAYGGAKTPNFANFAVSGPRFRLDLFSGVKNHINAPKRDLAEISEKSPIFDEKSPKFDQFWRKCRNLGRVSGEVLQCGNLGRVSGAFFC